MSVEEFEQLDALRMRAISPASTIRSAASWKSATSNASFKSAQSDLKRQLAKQLGTNEEKKKQRKPDVARKPGSKKRKGKSPQMARYIYKVLQSVAPNQGISKKSMVIMDNFMMDIFDRITSQLHHLVRSKGKLHGHKTISTLDIQTATKLILPGELASHAISNGVNAVTHYFKNKND